MTPFQELVSNLKRNKGFNKNVEHSLRIWVKDGEAIDAMLKHRVFPLTDEQRQGLDMVKDYLKPDENNTIQRLSELFRANEQDLS